MSYFKPYVSKPLPYDVIDLLPNSQDDSCSCPAKSGQCTPSLHNLAVTYYFFDDFDNSHGQEFIQNKDEKPVRFLIVVIFPETLLGFKDEGVLLALKQLKNDWFENGWRRTCLLGDLEKEL
jgi:hypothetical protein